MNTEGRDGDIGFAEGAGEAERAWDAWVLAYGEKLSADAHVPP